MLNFLKNKEQQSTRGQRYNILYKTFIEFDKDDRWKMKMDKEKEKVKKELLQQKKGYLLVNEQRPEKSF
jgi:hypothetical protein